jgi:hypothetical protein
MSLKPSELAVIYSQSMVLPASEFATCKRCLGNFLPDISLHPSICCIGKSPNYSSGATNFYTRDRRGDVENFPGYWLDIATCSSNRIEMRSPDRFEAPRTLVEFFDDVTFDALCSVVRAKAKVSDSIVQFSSVIYYEN